MEFNHLESFISVVKHNSFSLAAKELFITQPTVSNNIQSLEKELNTTLLDRTSKNIRLTDSGKLFYKYAVELINMRAKAKHSIMEHSKTIEGEIEISASSIPEQYILPYIIRDFTHIYPDVTFTVNHKNSKDVVDEILNGKLHYGIVGAKYSSDILEYIDFYEDELLLGVANNENYPWPNDTLLDLEVLYSEKLILRKSGSGTRRLIEQKLNKVGISLGDLDVISYIDSNEMIKQMIQLGLGVSFISKIAVQNEVELNKIKTLRINGLTLKRSFYFVYNKNMTLSPVVEAFKDFLIDWK